MQLTIFYDGTCPLCVAEMKMLRDLDHRSAIRLEDIYAENFNERYPEIDIQAADKILHGIDAEGNRLFGLDVTATAWALVGKKRWIAILRWPVIRWFADRAYLLFARNRQSISSVIMGTKACDSSEACQIADTAPKASRNRSQSPDQDAKF